MKKILCLILLTMSVPGEAFSQIGWWTSSDTLNVFNKNKGSVLIGSYQPLGKLTVGPDDKFYNLSLVGDYNNLAKNYLQIGVTGRGFENLQGQTIFDLYHSNKQPKNAGYNFRINGNSQFFINGEGNIGIGTEKPEAKLDLSGGPNWGGFTKALKIPAEHAIKFESNGSEYGMVATGGSLNFVLSNQNATANPFGVPFSRIMSIQRNKVVIEGDIEVRGKIVSQGQVTQNTVNTNDVASGILNNTSSSYTPSSNNSNLQSSLNNSADMQDDQIIQAHGQKKIKFMTGQSSRMIINDNGNVAIGTERTSRHKLTVEGVIAARKVIVTQQEWADFVFEPSYKLRELSELESYVQHNKHLPEIPSSSQIQSAGLDLGNTQARLLQKIEELTLYVIDQDKRLKKQEQDIKLLREQVKNHEK